MHINMTKTVFKAIEDVEVRKAVNEAIERFFSGDWGNISDFDKEANDADQAAGTGRILARYSTPRDDIYIIFYPGSDEAPMILFCNEY